MLYFDLRVVTLVVQQLPYSTPFVTKTPKLTSRLVSLHDDV